MKQRLALVVAVMTTMAGLHLMGADRQAGQTDATARAKGRELYVNHCASCHGTSARGDGPAGGSLRRPPSDLTSFAQRNGGVFPSARLRRIIDGREVGAHGSVEMPVWGAVFKASGNGGATAAAARIDLILAYLQGIQERAGQD